jgi:hypothetical protein
LHWDVWYSVTLLLEQIIDIELFKWESNAFARSSDMKCAWVQFQDALSVIYKRLLSVNTAVQRFVESKVLKLSTCWFKYIYQKYIRSCFGAPCWFSRWNTCLSVVCTFIVLSEGNKNILIDKKFRNTRIIETFTICFGNQFTFCACGGYYTDFTQIVFVSHHAMLILYVFTLFVLFTPLVWYANITFCSCL